MSPKISIVLTSYNRPNLVEEAIRSVFAQTFTNWELLLMDDGSNEETIETLDRVVDELDITNLDPRVFFCGREVDEEERSTKCRYALNINDGLKLSDGEYITYLTDDCLFLPNRLERMAHELDNDPNKMVVYGMQRVQVRYDGDWRNFRIRNTIGKTRSPMCQVDHNSIMHRALCLEKLTKPYWVEDKSAWMDGDAYFFEKLATHFDFYPIQEVLDICRIHDNSVQSLVKAGKSPLYSEEI